MSNFLPTLKRFLVTNLHCLDKALSAARICSSGSPIMAKAFFHKILLGVPFIFFSIYIVSEKKYIQLSFKIVYRQHSHSLLHFRYCRVVTSPIVCFVIDIVVNI